MRSARGVGDYRALVFRDVRGLEVQTLLPGRGAGLRAGVEVGLTTHDGWVLCKIW